MHRQLIPVVAVCLAALALAPVPAAGSPQQCNDHGQGPPPHARGEPNRKGADRKSVDCSGSQDPGSTSDDPSTDEEQTMNQGNFAASAVLLVTALASGGADASGGSLSFALGQCNTESQTAPPDVGCFKVAGQRVCPPPVDPIGSDGNVCRLLRIVTDGALNVGATPDCPNGTIATPTGSGVVEFLINGAPVISQAFDDEDVGDLSSGYCGN